MPLKYFLFWITCLVLRNGLVLAGKCVSKECQFGTNYVKDEQNQPRIFKGKLTNAIFNGTDEREIVKSKGVTANTRAPPKSLPIPFKTDQNQLSWVNVPIMSELSYMDFKRSNLDEDGIYGRDARQKHLTTFSDLDVPTGSDAPNKELPPSPKAYGKIGKNGGNGFSSRTNRFSRSWGKKASALDANDKPKQGPQNGLTSWHTVENLYENLRFTGPGSQPSPPSPREMGSIARPDNLSGQKVPALPPKKRDSQKPLTLMQEQIRLEDSNLLGNKISQSLLAPKPTHYAENVDFDAKVRSENEPHQARSTSMSTISKLSSKDTLNIAQAHLIDEEIRKNQENDRVNGDMKVDRKSLNNQSVKRRVRKNREPDNYEGVILENGKNPTDGMQTNKSPGMYRSLLDRVSYLKFKLGQKFGKKNTAKQLVQIKTPKIWKDYVPYPIITSDNKFFDQMQEVSRPMDVSNDQKHIKDDKTNPSSPKGVSKDGIPKLPQTSTEQIKGTELSKIGKSHQVKNVVNSDNSKISDPNPNQPTSGRSVYKLLPGKATKIFHWFGKAKQEPAEEKGKFEFQDSRFVLVVRKAYEELLDFSFEKSYRERLERPKASKKSTFEAICMDQQELLTSCPQNGYAVFRLEERGKGGFNLRMNIEGLSNYEKPIVFVNSTTRTLSATRSSHEPLYFTKFEVLDNEKTILLHKGNTFRRCSPRSFWQQKQKIPPQLLMNQKAGNHPAFFVDGSLGTFNVCPIIKIQLISYDDFIMSVGPVTDYTNTLLPSTDTRAVTENEKKMVKTDFSPLNFRNSKRSPSKAAVKRQPSIKQKFNPRLNTGICKTSYGPIRSLANAPQEYSIYWSGPEMII